MLLTEYDEAETMAKLSAAIERRAFQKGRTEGRTEGHEDVARAMLLSGRYPAEEIASLTGFSVDEINTLA